MVNVLTWSVIDQGFEPQFQIMYINERIKDIEDIQNGITVEHVVLYDKLRIFSCDGPARQFKIGICCFSAKHATLWTKSKDWLALNQNNVFEWSDMSTHGLLFQ
jgi:hypothetical protein